MKGSISLIISLLYLYLNDVMTFPNDDESCANYVFSNVCYISRNSCALSFSH
jgi:hypothetical protein